VKRSEHRILTTHCGSLPRPHDLLDMMKAKVSGQPYDAAAFDQRAREVVAECVRKQVETGIDVVTDGEQSKPGFFTYVTERLNGFEPRPGGRAGGMFAAEVETFPEYYQEYFSQRMTGGAVVPVTPLLCTGPVSYRGHEPLQRDINNLKAALQGLDVVEAFMPAVSPSGVGANQYYASEEAFLFAVADALHQEYQAIVDAGFVLQVDDPFLTDIYSYSGASQAEKRKTAELDVEAVNHALRGIPRERVRFHTCYGINEGPRVHDAPIKELLDVLLRVNAQAFSFEAANARHEHEYHAWEGVKLPEGTILIPGVITHASNIVEHPEWIAERLRCYASIVGREQVMAGADCGFSSQATYKPEVHPSVIWAKFQAMAEGARLASQELWK
jgi:5-methyltetrahydropteroyltriglutamate--homocysteine methyltransferase